MKKRDWARVLQLENVEKEEGAALRAESIAMDGPGYCMRGWIGQKCRLDLKTPDYIYFNRLSPV